MSRQTLVTSVHPDGHSKKEDLKPSSSSRGYQQRLIDLGLRWHVSTIPQGTVADSDFLMPTGLDAWARVASQLGDRDSAEPSPVPRLERWPHVVEFTRGQHSGSRRPSAWDPATMLRLPWRRRGPHRWALKMHERLAPLLHRPDQDWEGSHVRRPSDDLAGCSNRVDNPPPRQPRSSGCPRAAVTLGTY